MNQKVPIVISGIVSIAILGFFTVQIPLKIKYHKARDPLLLEAKPFAVHPIDAEAAGFLQSVRESWEVLDHESPDSIFSEISSVAGVEESVEGVVRFHTHEIPEYSFFDHRRNTKELVMATTLAVALPMSVDQRIYLKEGLCFIKLSDNLVEVYEDSEQGLSRIRYVKAKGGDSGSAAEPAAFPSK